MPTSDDDAPVPRGRRPLGRGPLGRGPLGRGPGTAAPNRDAQRESAETATEPTAPPGPEAEPDAGLAGEPGPGAGAAPAPERGAAPVADPRPVPAQESGGAQVPEPDVGVAGEPGPGAGAAPEIVPAPEPGRSHTPTPEPRPDTEPEPDVGVSGEPGAAPENLPALEHEATAAAYGDGRRPPAGGGAASVADPRPGPASESGGGQGLEPRADTGPEPEPDVGLAGDLGPGTEPGSGAAPESLPAWERGATDAAYGDGRRPPAGNGAASAADPRPVLAPEPGGPQVPEHDVGVAGDLAPGTAPGIVPALEREVTDVAYGDGRPLPAEGGAARVADPRPGPASESGGGQGLEPRADSGPEAERGSDFAAGPPGGPQSDAGAGAEAAPEWETGARSGNPAGAGLPGGPQPEAVRGAEAGAEWEPGAGSAPAAGVGLAGEPQPDAGPGLDRGSDSATGLAGGGPQSGIGSVPVPDAGSRGEAGSGPEPGAAPEPGSGPVAEPAPEAEAPDDGRFKVVLDNFEGPFDLLLQLISRHKLDVTEVALSKVTDEFMVHIRAMGPDWDLDQTTEFLVVAATLLDLKAARLLPSAEVEDEGDLALLEARDLLFARLLQYRAYKQIAAIFADRLAAEGRRYPRTVGLEPHHADLLPEVALRIGPEGFAQLAVKAMRPRPKPQVYVEHIHAPLVSVREQAELVVARLRELGEATFATLTEDAPDTLTVVARFLALLELYRERAVALDQEEALGTLTVRWSGGAAVVTPQVTDEFDQERAPEEREA